MADARIGLGVNLNNDAGRGACLAAFHAAQALIFERTRRVAKTHRGVHAEFGKLAREVVGLDSQAAGFLQRAYNLKAVADYETGPESEIPPDRAAAAVAEADAFVRAIAEDLTDPDAG